MARKAPRMEPLTVEAFLHWDAGGDTRYELYDGQPVAMNPPTALYARLLMEVGFALRRRLPPECAVYGGAGVGILQPNDQVDDRIPDLVVSCADSRAQWIEAPRLVVEVLSASTKRVDAGDKLAFYADIATIEAIVLVWVARRRVDLWRRQPDSWSVRSFIGSADLPLRAPTAPVPVDELYRPLGL